MKSSLYVHLPFCRQICPYCDFCRQVYQEKTVDEYLTVLIEDIPEGDFNSIYLGGGTPSCLNQKQLVRLLSILQNRTTGEYCIEANVEDVNEGLLKLLKEYGVNRLSLGVQSFNDELLNFCQRSYNGKQAVKAIELTKEYFDNFSLDFIYGFQGFPWEIHEYDIKQAIALGAPHISLYALTIEKTSIWGRLRRKTMADDEVTREQYDKAVDLLKAGYQHYEISNFAKAGYQAQTNLVYWHYQDYYGRGLGACGKEKNWRYEYTHNMTEYLANKTLIEDLTLSKEEMMFEYLMMNFRLAEGVNIKEFAERFGFSFRDCYKAALAKNKKCLLVNGDNIAINPDYWFVSNHIIKDFLFTD